MYVCVESIYPQKHLTIPCVLNGKLQICSFEKRIGTISHWLHHFLFVFSFQIQIGTMSHWLHHLLPRIQCLGAYGNQLLLISLFFERCSGFWMHLAIFSTENAVLYLKLIWPIKIAMINGIWWFCECVFKSSRVNQCLRSNWIPYWFSRTYKKKKKLEMSKWYILCWLLFSVWVVSVVVVWNQNPGIVPTLLFVWKWHLNGFSC